MRFLDRTKGIALVAAAAMLTVIGIAAGLANGAPANTSLLPGRSTNITGCTTSLSLSASQSPSVLRCAARVDDDDHDFASDDDNLIVYVYNHDVIHHDDDHHARDHHDYTGKWCADVRDG